MRSNFSVNSRVSASDTWADRASYPRMVSTAQRVSRRRHPWQRSGQDAPLMVLGGSIGGHAGVFGRQLPFPQQVDLILTYLLCPELVGSAMKVFGEMLNRL